jgi:hypothetical protein
MKNLRYVGNVDQDRVFTAKVIDGVIDFARCAKVTRFKELIFLAVGQPDAKRSEWFALQERL